eukprot:1887567-Amphidinium_carterae.1
MSLPRSRANAQPAWQPKPLGCQLGTDKRAKVWGTSCKAAKCWFGRMFLEKVRVQKHRLMLCEHCPCGLRHPDPAQQTAAALRQSQKSFLYRTRPCVLLSMQWLSLTQRAIE